MYNNLKYITNRDAYMLVLIGVFGVVDMDFSSLSDSSSSRLDDFPRRP